MLKTSLPPPRLGSWPDEAANPSFAERAVSEERFPEPVQLHTPRAEMGLLPGVAAIWDRIKNRASNDATYARRLLLRHGWRLFVSPFGRVLQASIHVRRLAGMWTDVEDSGKAQRETKRARAKSPEPRAQTSETRDQAQIPEQSESRAQSLDRA